MTAPALHIADVHAGYGPVAVLEDVSVTVGQGRLVGLLGANGAGKSTLLRVVSGIVTPSAGTVRLHGEDVTGEAVSARVRRGLSHVPEGRQVFADLSVEENLLTGGLVRSNRRALRPQLDRAFDLFPVLRDRRRQLAGTLSGGEQQMLAIARGLMAEPTVLLLDEPSLGLAPVVVETLYETVQRLHRTLGLTVLLVEQNAALCADIADELYLLQAGSVVGSGPAADLRATDAFRDAYLGVGR